MSIMDNDNTNVTMRRQMSTVRPNRESSSNSSSEDIFVNSLDTCTGTNQNDTELLKYEIEGLKACLDTAQNELENVILENNGLKKYITELTQEINILKHQNTNAREGTCKNKLQKRGSTHSDTDGFQNNNPISHLKTSCTNTNVDPEVVISNSVSANITSTQVNQTQHQHEHFMS